MARLTFIPLLFLLILLINADTVTGATDYPGDSGTTTTETTPTETTTTTETTTPDTTSTETTESIDTGTVTEDTAPDSVTSATDYPETEGTEDTKTEVAEDTTTESDAVEETTKPDEEEIARPEPEEEKINSPEEEPEEIALDTDSETRDEESVAEDTATEEKAVVLEEDTETPEDETSEKTDAETKATGYPIEEDFFAVTFIKPPLEQGEQKEMAELRLDEDSDMTEIFPDTYEINKLEDFIVEKSEDEKSDVDTMIIFDSPSDDMVPPSNRYQYLENKEQVLRTDFEMDDFTPGTLDEFLAVQPDFTYDRSGTILPGSNTINEIAGEAAFALAFGDFKRNRLNSSLALLRKLIHYNYRIKDAYYYLALCLYQKKEFRASIRCLLKSTEQTKESDSNEFFKNYDSIGNIYSRLGEYNKAILYYNKALRFSTDQVDIYNKLGFMYYYLKSYKNALNYWQKAGDEGNLESKKNYEWLQEMLNSGQDK